MKKYAVAVLLSNGEDRVDEFDEISDCMEWIHSMLVTAALHGIDIQAATWRDTLITLPGDIRNPLSGMHG